MLMQSDDVPDGRPFHERVAEERIRRGWTQKDVAERVGMSLHSYNTFENGKTSPQRRNLQAIQRLFKPEEAPARRGRAPERREELYPRDVEAFRDMIGVFLSTLPDEDDRQEVIFAMTRVAFEMIRPGLVAGSEGPEDEPED